MVKISISPELKKHIWPLKKEEYAQLEENILSEGISEIKDCEIKIWSE